MCRVDVGMSQGCGDHAPEVLEIVNDTRMYKVLADGTREALDKQGKQWAMWQQAGDILQSAARSA